MAYQATDHYEDEPWPEAYEWNTPEGFLTLDTIPDEIILLIAMAMAVDIHIPYVPKESHTNPSTIEGDKCRQGLVNLCLVSKHMNNVAQEALYKNIRIPDANTLVLLYHSFLGNPYLGIYVKQMSLSIFNDGDWAGVGDGQIYQSAEIDLGPILDWNDELRQHELPYDLGKYLATPYTGSRLAPHRTCIELLYVLEFRVLSHTRNLDSLDLCVHPQYTPNETYEIYNMDKIYLEIANGVLLSIWEEVSRCLANLKKLFLTGREFPLRSDFMGLMCRYFLTLPELDQLIWFNDAPGWFDGMSNMVLSGSDNHSSQNIEGQYPFIRILDLGESSCFPRDLVALCFTFPNLESLSVDTDSWRCKSILRSDLRPPQLVGDQDPNSGMGAMHLTDSLARLEHLHTLNLDLHYAYNISHALGRSRYLSLTNLPHLQHLSVPFHFFVRRELEGHHAVINPAHVLPPSLRKLNIMSCFSCLQFWIGNPLYGECLTYRHQSAVLEFLEGLANIHCDVLPNLREVYYQESRVLEDIEYCACNLSQDEHSPSQGRYDEGSAVKFCPFHFQTDFDKSRLTALSQALYQRGILFGKWPSYFTCPEY